MPDFKDLKSLFKHIEKDVERSMKQEVTEKVKDVEQEKIQEVVYDAYKPLNEDEPWKRRHHNDGLIDRDNMERTYSKEGDNHIIKIKNTTDSNPNSSYTAFTKTPNYLAGIIENERTKGLYMFDREGGYGYREPRPFTFKTIKELERTLAHVKAMKDGLRKSGYKIE